MRYEDASQTGAAGSDVNARDDAEHLAGNDFGPATGNLITGVGHHHRRRRHRHGGPGAHITAIAGRRRTPVRSPSGKLEVAGQYGTLTIDAEGNYTYVRNPGSPEGVSRHLHLHARRQCRRHRHRQPGHQHRQDLPVAAGARPTRPSRPPTASSRFRRGRAFRRPRRWPQPGHRPCPTARRWSSSTARSSCRSWSSTASRFPRTNLAALLIDSEPKPAAGEARRS